MTILRTVWLATALSWASLAAAAATPSVVMDGIPHQALFAIDFDGDTGYVVGAGGEILRSDDRGASWHAEHAPSVMALLGVAARAEHVIAVGQMGAIALRSAQGEWRSVDSGTDERLFSVAVNASGVALAAGAFGALLRSTDGGQTWASAAPSWVGAFDDQAGRLGVFFEPSLYSVQIRDDGHAWVVGELGLVMASQDGGQSWQVAHAGVSRESGANPTLFGVEVRADGVGFAVGQEGYLLSSRDHGQSWQESPRPTHANLFGVTFGADGMVLATGMRDTVISTDHGVTWQHVDGEDIATGWYSAATQVGSDAPLMVGNAGRILRINQ